MIDFESESNVVLLNPRLKPAVAEVATGWLQSAQRLTGHVFVLTSGTSGKGESGMKWVALSKEAILASARASNRVMECTSADVWLHCLPRFHVGGIGMDARAFASGSSVVDLPTWSAAGFLALAREKRATLASLVPAQVHDLVEEGLSAPPSMRAILVGAGAIHDELYEAGRQLGWPLLRTFGMSETVGQAATERLTRLSNVKADPAELRVMPHLEMRIDDRAQIQIRGASLLTCYVMADGELVDPKDAEGWMTTQDIGRLDGDCLTILGRASDHVKIGGESVSVAVLNMRLAACAGRDASAVTILAWPDERLEYTIGLVAEEWLSESRVASIKAAFDAEVLPFERARKVVRVPEIPRTDLGKVKIGDLRELLSRESTL